MTVRYSCHVCGAISDAKRCPQHALPPRGAKARARGELRAFVIARDRGTCQLCGDPVPAGCEHIDHRIPVAQGGATTAANLQLVCAACNRSKGSL